MAEMIRTIFGAVVFVLAVHAQVGTASLSGVVTDPTGSVVPNASVTLDSALQKYRRATVTGPTGEYTLPALPPGDYTLVVSAAGFLSATRTGVSLSSGQASTLDVQLSVASAAEQVTVSEAAPLLQTATATLGTTLPSRHVTDLPVLGRSFLNLILLTPAAAPVPPLVRPRPTAPSASRSCPRYTGSGRRTTTLRWMAWKIAIRTCWACRCSLRQRPSRR